jgi:hypothetical protein
VGAAIVQDLRRQLVRAFVQRDRLASGRRRDPSGKPDGCALPSGDVLAEPPQRVNQFVGFVVGLEPHDGAPEDPHGDPSAVPIEIDLFAVRPRLCGVRDHFVHLLGELGDSLLGEDGLEHTPSDHPFGVGEVEQRSTVDVSLVGHEREVPIHERVGGGQHVTRTAW